MKGFITQIVKAIGEESGFYFRNKNERENIKRKQTFRMTCIILTSQKAFVKNLYFEWIYKLLELASCQSQGILH